MRAEDAFGNFYQATAASLWKYVYRTTGNAADADDIVQEAFLRLLRAPPADEDAWRPYLYRVASNLVVDRWRNKAREREHESDFGSDVITRAVAGGLQASDEQDVARMFEALTTRERALLWLAYVEGESHEEIAASLGLGRLSIKVLLFRAKRRLRALLKSRGVATT